MTNSVKPNPVGHEVLDFELQGQEFDGQGRWVGADTSLRIPPVGRFFLNLVTAEYLLSEGLTKFLIDREHPEDLLEESSEPERTLPYVVNDSELSDEVLKRELQGVRVGAGLANCLWYDGPLG